MHHTGFMVFRFLLAFFEITLRETSLNFWNSHPMLYFKDNFHPQLLCRHMGWVTNSCATITKCSCFLYLIGKGLLFTYQRFSTSQPLLWWISVPHGLLFKAWKGKSTRSHFSINIPFLPPHYYDHSGTFERGHSSPGDNIVLLCHGRKDNLPSPLFLWILYTSTPFSIWYHNGKANKVHLN